MEFKNFFRTGLTKRTLAIALVAMLAISTASEGFAKPWSSKPYPQWSRTSTTSTVTKALVTIAAVSLATNAAQAYQNRTAQPGTITATPSNSTNSACATQLPGGRAPTFTNPKMGEGLQMLCYEEFTVGYSGALRSPLWSAEYLSPERIQAARGMKRQNTFHEDLALPPQARAHLKDFVGSGYDRGHMAPSGDMSNSSSQNESFSLANIIAQDSVNNQNVWAEIESGTRTFAVREGGVHVITGPLFIGQNLQFLRDRVAIPTQMFKVLYLPTKKVGGVYVVENTNTRDIAWKSIPDFERLSGYRLGLGNPALMQMPAPQRR
jgi:endonuclease G, mitochondrial